MCKSYIIKILHSLFRPFIGTGIGNYFPFKQFIAFYSGIAANEHTFILKRVSHGFLMELEAGKLVDEIIIKTGIWEKGVSEIIKMYLKAGDTFVDIGANIGYDTLLASTIVGVDGHVLSFEPSTKNFNRLQRNITYNKFVNIQAYNIGLGNKKESLIIYYNDFNPGETSLIALAGSSSKPDEQVIIDTLDNIIQTRRIDLIKMDIEGFEPRAFEGMKQTLQHNQNLKIIFEFSPFLYGNEMSLQREVAMKLLTELQDYGFELYYITEKNNLLNQKIVDIDTYCGLFFEGNMRQSDIFCTKTL